MLKSLYIRDFAIIDELEIEFESGLNIITGETGAGKSIIVNALKLALGARASADVIKAGRKKTVVEAIFDVYDSDSLDSAFEESNVEKESSLILRREISRTQSRAFVNDSPVRLGVLKKFTSELIDLHGQHEHQSLLKSEHHIRMLDQLADHKPSLAEFGQEYRLYQALQSKLDEIRSEIERQKQRSELNDFKLAEIVSVDPQAGEDDRLFAQFTRLQNIDRLRAETERIVSTLLEADSSIVELLSESTQTISDLANLDQDLTEHARELSSTVVAIQEVAAELRRYSDRIESSPEKLQSIEARLSELEHLKRKYGGTLDAVLDLWHRLKSEQIDEAALLQRETQLDSELQACSNNLVRLAQLLSDERLRVAESLTGQLADQLADLGMENSIFEVRMESLENAPVSIEDNGSQRMINQRGMDSTEFYITTNKGMPLKPLSRIASGGEVSRIMLALKSVLADRSDIPVLLFDEIDVGISGRVAQKVGATMHRLATSHQIIAITHLPQIAALGDAHFVVEKSTSSDAVSTSVRRLTIEERAAQVAKLLGGEDVSGTAIEHARTLLETGTVEN